MGAMGSGQGGDRDHRAKQRVVTEPNELFGRPEQVAPPSLARRTRSSAVSPLNALTLGTRRARWKATAWDGMRGACGGSCGVGAVSADGVDDEQGDDQGDQPAACAGERHDHRGLIALM
jgi:hypothetical protein